MLSGWDYPARIWLANHTYRDEHMWNDNDKIMGIFDKANEGGMQFPCQCPVCQKQSAHVYIHRHNDKHSGIWTWCNECGASVHLSGQTPSWWVNPDFVDADQLFLRNF